MRIGAVRRAAGLAIVLAGWAASAAGQSANLKMGNPSGASADPAARDNYLLDKPEYATSYNNGKGTPNWVSWRLAKADLGRAPRDSFYADPALPAGFLRVEPAEYDGSGFDRGHMCPHGDRTASAASSLATFAMTNIIPQSHDLNTMAWESLEDYCRDLALNQGKTLYVVAGPAGPPGGTGKRGLAATTPDGKVVVPSRNWKVVMVLDEDVASAKDLTDGSAIHLIAIIAPNADGESANDWTQFLVTVNQVEALTGYTFFDAVAPAVINPLKGEVSQVTIPHYRVERVRGRIDRPVAPAIAPVEPPATPGGLMPAPVAPAPARPQEPPVPETPATAALRRAVAGLSYPSESDEPLEVFDWGAAPGRGPLTDAQLWHLSGMPPEARVERVEPARFFDRLVRPKHPRGQVTPAQAGRYEALLGVLQGELADLEVIKVGQSEVAIFIIGRAKDGHLVGIRTGATET